MNTATQNPATGEIKEEKPKVATLNFLQMISVLGGGQITELSSKKMKQLIKACEMSGQKGKFILEIGCKPGKSGNAMTFTAKIAIKEPASEPIEGFLYTDYDGNASKNDPQDLFNHGGDKQANVQRIQTAIAAAPQRVAVENGEIKA